MTVVIVLLGLKHLQKFDLPISPLPLSWSQINSMGTCDLKWYLDYVMKYRKHLPVPDVAQQGRTLHKWMEEGFNDAKLIDGEVDLWGGIQDNIPDEFIEGLYWIEDFIQKWWDTVKNTPGMIFSNFFKPRMEMQIHSVPQLYNGIWYRRFGYVDMAWELPNGHWILWDFKTGRYSQYSIRLGLRQLYYYKSIFESWNMPVASTALMFPYSKQIVQRTAASVPRGSKNISKFSTVSMKSVENLIKKSIDNLLTSPIKAKYNEWYCPEWCPYADPFLLICNFEEHQDMSRFKPVSNREELVELMTI